MTKSITALKTLMAALILLTAGTSAEAGRIVTEKMQSKILNAERHYNVYLPDGFDATRPQKYPVLYLLHGLGDDHTGWAIKGQMQIVTDELMASGEAVPMIIVMPNAGGDVSKGDWCGYFNMPGWSYERFFFEEFMPYIEKKFNIASDKQHRAVSGLSMGGGGSVSYCQKHPELFSSCYAMSAWLDQDVDDKKRAETTKLAYVQVAVHDNSCIEYLKKADGAAKDRLKTVKWYVDCGDDDYLLKLNETFHMLMRDNNIKCELRVRNGSHNWEYWHTALRASLPFASRNFGK